MKNKGFTLVELIITIALIAVISVTIGVSMTGMFSRQEEKDAEAYVVTIENAACMYVEISGTTDIEVTIAELLDNGFLNAELQNPITNKSISDYRDNIVEINWNNGEKTCNYELPNI